MVTICLVITPETVHAEDLLVFMYGSGSVERYDADGKHLGTFISGLLHGWEGQRMDRRRIVYKCVDGSRGIVYNCGMTITQSNKRQTELASTHSRLTLADNVVERIRNEIISGVLAPGTMLAEIPTAQRLEVSRVPVREAFRELEHDGLLVFEANGRCHVQTLTARDFDEIYNVRLMLETESFRLAALNHSEPDLKALRNNIRKMERARSLNRMTLLDIEFHDQIMEMSRQSRLIHLWGVMRSQIQLFTAILQREISSMITNVRDVSVEAHVKCVSGIESRDPDLARQCAIEHLGPWNKWLKTTRPEGGAV